MWRQKFGSANAGSLKKSDQYCATLVKQIICLIDSEESTFTYLVRMMLSRLSSSHRQRTFAAANFNGYLPNEAYARRTEVPIT